MTVAYKDLQIYFNSVGKKKIVKNIFSNILISSAILCLFLIFVFRINIDNLVASFLYGYMGIVGVNLLTAMYIKEDYNKKNELSINNDLGDITHNAGYGISPIIKKGQAEPSFIEDNNFLDSDIDEFLNN